MVIPEMIIEMLVSFSEWILDNPIEGMILMLGVYILGTALMLPASFFALATAYLCCELMGALLGYIMGIFLIFLASSTGASMAFFISKCLLKETVKNCIKPNWVKMRALYMVINERGLKVVLLCRLSPILPYNILNYFFGASEVKVKDYLLGGIGMLPMICLYAYVAMSVQSITEAIEDGDDQWYLYMIIGGAVLLIATVIYITCLAKKKLDTIVEAAKEEIQS